MVEKEAREKLYRIIILNGLTEYLEGKDIHTCSLEDINEFKKKMAKRYHPDLNQNLSEKDKDVYKIMNGLFATILKNKKSNATSNQNNYNQTRTSNQDEFSKDFEAFIKNLELVKEKYRQYKDFSLLKEKINQIINDFARNRAHLKYNSPVFLERELSVKIDALFRNHFKKKLVESITSTFISSSHYDILKKYIDIKIEESLTKMSLTNYNNYEEIQIQLTQNIYKQLALLTTLREKIREFDQRLSSASLEIRRTTEYQQIFNEFKNWESKQVYNLEEVIHYVDELSRRYDKILSQKRNEENEEKRKTENSHIYIPRFFTTRGNFGDGINYLKQNYNQYLLFGIVRNIDNSLPSIKNVSPQELFREYELLEDFLQQAEFLGRTIRFAKFGITMEDILNSNTYDFATLLYANKDTDIGLYMKMNKGKRFFYFDKIGSFSFLDEDDSYKEIINAYRSKIRLIKDMEEYVKQQLVTIRDNPSFRLLYQKTIDFNLGMNRMNNMNKLNKDLYDIRNISADNKKTTLK